MNVIKKPHLPDYDVSLFVCDNVLNSGSNFLPSFTLSDVLFGINSHPDMSVCPLFDGDVIVAKEGYCYYKKILPESLNIIKGENDLKKEYPFDIALNAVIIDGKLFHNLKYTDKALLKYCQNKNIEFVNVKQGYTKCSTLIVDEKSVITSDKKLNEIYLKNGLDSLFVSNDDILINNFEHGFIGGCGGKISKDTIGFFGDITKHKDYMKIKEFLTKRNIKHKMILNGPLFDYGSLIPLCT